MWPFKPKNTAYELTHSINGTVIRRDVVFSTTPLQTYTKRLDPVIIEKNHFIAFRDGITQLTNPFDMVVESLRVLKPDVEVK
jgi:hypothetical protein